MKEKSAYYLVEESALPEVLLKTIRAKRILETEKAENISEAVKIADISRSAFYKYKDLIKPFYESQIGKKITFLLVLEDVSGVLSNILKVMAKSKANILTINQNIPVNGVANITVTIETKELIYSVEKLVQKLQQVEGVSKIDIISNGV
jgi:chorismate mutase